MRFPRQIAACLPKRPATQPRNTRQTTVEPELNAVALFSVHPQHSPSFSTDALRIPPPTIHGRLPSLVS